MVETTKDAGKLQLLKDTLGLVQGLVTILAVVVGGVWTYSLFVVQRQNHPRLKIEHRVTHWKISDKENLISVDEKVFNTGSVLLRIRGGLIRIIKVSPPPVQITGAGSSNSRAVQSIEDPKVWQVLVESTRTWAENDLVIEPGESDEINNVFVIPSDVKVFAVFSYFSNPTGVKDNLGWRELSFYDVQESRVLPIKNKEGGNSALEQSQ